MKAKDTMKTAVWIPAILLLAVVAGIIAIGIHHVWEKRHSNQYLSLTGLEGKPWEFLGRR